MGMYYGANKDIRQKAKCLRRNMTRAEMIVWNRLRKDRGIKFRRQHPVEYFIVDFYCHKLGLVIEIDGSIHEKESQRNRDIEKSKRLTELGLRVIRFTNDEVYMKEDFVIQQIQKVVDEILYGNP